MKTKRNSLQKYNNELYQQYYRCTDLYYSHKNQKQKLYRNVQKFDGAKTYLFFLGSLLQHNN